MSLADYCLTQMGIPRFVPRRQGLTRVKAVAEPVEKPAAAAAVAPSVVADSLKKLVNVNVVPAPPVSAPEPAPVHVPAPAALAAKLPAASAAKPAVAKPAVAKPAAAPSDKARLAAIQACGTLTELNALMQSCTQCPLHQQRKQAVPGAGVEQPTWFIVGEAPGAEEDEAGLPFVGHSGKLLTSIFAYFGIAREAAPARPLGQAFVVNAVKCRPLGNRPPTIDEVVHCRPFLEKQIALTTPKIIMAVGRSATLALVGDDKTPLGKMRGRILRYNPSTDHPTRDTPIVATYHPAFLIRNPKERRSSWDDLVFAINVLRDLLKPHQ